MANNTRYFVLANYTQKAIAGMVLGLKMAVTASGAVSEVHILEAMDPTAALEHAGAAAKVYTPAG